MFALACNISPGPGADAAAATGATAACIARRLDRYLSCPNIFFRPAQRGEKSRAGMCEAVRTGTGLEARLVGTQAHVLQACAENEACG